MSAALPAMSQTSLGNCASLERDLDRLKCYDNLARESGVAPQISSVPESEWSIKAEANPIDDSQTVSLSLNAKNVKSRSGKPITLFLRCESGQAKAYLMWYDFLGASNATITTRFDDAKAFTTKWPVTSDNLGVIIPGDVLQFIKNLEAVNQLVVQVDPHNGGSVTAIFNTIGLTQAVRPFAEACGFKN